MASNVATKERAVPAAALDVDLAKKLLYDMMLIRRFEEKAAENYALGKIGGFLHLSIGEEAVAAGATSVLRPDDYAISTYREHGHCLAKGSDPRRAMAELFGRRDGLSKGKGGSMHLFDKSRNFLGGHAIVGAHLPLAAGAAFAVKYQGGDQVVICYFGDGSVPEGEFHESMNLASLWKLPVIFLCENNRYGMGTAFERVAAVTDIVEHACSYDMAAELVDGMNAMTVYDATKRAVDRARKSGHPTLLEVRTYRFMGHSMSDPAHGHYRTKDEVDEHRKRDPLLLLKQTIMSQNLGADADFKQLEREVGDTVAAAIKFADDSPFPTRPDLFADVLQEQAES